MSIQQYFLQQKMFYKGIQPKKQGEVDLMAGGLAYSQAQLANQQLINQYLNSIGQPRSAPSGIPLSSYPSGIPTISSPTPSPSPTPTPSPAPTEVHDKFSNPNYYSYENQKRKVTEESLAPTGLEKVSTNPDLEKSIIGSFEKDPFVFGSYPTNYFVGLEQKGVIVSKDIDRINASIDAYNAQTKQKNIAFDTSVTKSRLGISTSPDLENAIVSARTKNPSAFINTPSGYLGNLEQKGVITQKDIDKINAANNAYNLGVQQKNASSIADVEGSVKLAQQRGVPTIDITDANGKVIKSVSTDKALAEVMGLEKAGAAFGVSYKYQPAQGFVDKNGNPLKTFAQYSDKELLKKGMSQSEINAIRNPSAFTEFNEGNKAFFTNQYAFFTGKKEPFATPEGLLFGGDFGKAGSFAKNRPFYTLGNEVPNALEFIASAGVAPAIGGAKGLVQGYRGLQVASTIAKGLQKGEAGNVLYNVARVGKRGSNLYEISQGVTPARTINYSPKLDQIISVYRNAKNEFLGASKSVLPKGGVATIPDFAKAGGEAKVPVAYVGTGKNGITTLISGVNDLSKSPHSILIKLAKSEVEDNKLLLKSTGFKAVNDLKGYFFYAKNTPTLSKQIGNAKFFAPTADLNRYTTREALGLAKSALKGEQYPKVLMTKPSIGGFGKAARKTFSPFTRPELTRYFETPVSGLQKGTGVTGEITGGISKGSQRSKIITGGAGMDRIIAGLSGAGVQSKEIKAGVEAVGKYGFKNTNEFNDYSKGLDEKLNDRFTGTNQEKYGKPKTPSEQARAILLQQTYRPVKSQKEIARQKVMDASIKDWDQTLVGKPTKTVSPFTKDTANMFKNMARSGNKNTRTSRSNYLSGAGIFTGMEVGAATKQSQREKSAQTFIPFTVQQERFKNPFADMLIESTSQKERGNPFLIQIPFTEEKQIPDFLPIVDIAQKEKYVTGLVYQQKQENTIPLIPDLTFYKPPPETGGGRTAFPFDFFASVGSKGQGKKGSSKKGYKAFAVALEPFGASGGLLGDYTDTLTPEDVYGKRVARQTRGKKSSPFIQGFDLSDY
jgi:hypothetical protein